MAAEDFFESEVALAAAATAAVLSPRVRGLVRQGLVYGVAGVTVAARTVAGAAGTVGRGVADVLPLGNGSQFNRRPSSAVAHRTAAAKPATPKPAAPRARTAKRTAAARTKPAGAAAPGPASS